MTTYVKLSDVEHLIISAIEDTPLEHARRGKYDSVWDGVYQALSEIRKSADVKVLPSPEAQIRALTTMAALALEAAGQDVEAMRLRHCPINLQNRFGCALRVLGAIDTSSKMRWGLRTEIGSLRQAAAAEALDILRLGITSVLSSSVEEPAWLSVLVARSRVCVLRAGANPGNVMEQVYDDEPEDPQSAAG